MMDLFEKFNLNDTPLGKYYELAHGYFMYPQLEGEIGPRMKFMGKEMIVWSLNNYLGLANHPEVRKIDADASAEYGLAYPMGARMMSGHTKEHRKLEKELADFVKREDAFVLNYGYQGMFSIIDSLVNRKDVIVYDEEAHACIIDGMRLHIGKRFTYKHNDMESLEKQLQHAENLTKETGGGILVITEGVYGMTAELGDIPGIIALKDKYNFRLLIDDAHGIGTMGPTGAGTDEHFGLQSQVDLYFGTFAKAFAGIGAFIAGPRNVINYLRYNMRSQIYAKSLPMAMVLGIQKRLEMIKTMPELREKLWNNVHTLQNGLRNAGFDLGKTQSPVTPVFLNGGDREASNLVVDLRENYNIFCSIVTYPVVPKGIFLIRLIPSAAHSFEDIQITIKAFNEVKDKLDSGFYKELDLPHKKIIED
ncbi:MAG: aminotransferase class I/II-fold pyridoxal phosphate-dependent enzyme [Bacteroidales bacterium]|nr:aminotransferase class I/II-fold pyridoxal phosphate-dependent enzyme [Bacteroidales bacterium]HOB78106.1 aminotransferase class I/II-fold pyridoxal phosphate-dependent enzyme [Bacteroidales bacterium]HPZ60846.1 aminotransferase class I/II-fold pyridoxal phosphate-dependent enzyme [Bacteroidales bacterium]HQD58583.1 aminotransferase class I/II-fold pyridoxal phosphate-dependent enzyme [Bacteroidales bacterium]